MAFKISPSAKKDSVDRRIRGVLSKFGDSIDAFLGRTWKPAGSLATSELIESLKLLVDQESRDLGRSGRLAPHIIRLKAEWEMFGADSRQLLSALETELTVALVDHINDRRYHTVGPIDIEVRPDYFTSGVKLTATFSAVESDGGELEIAVEQSSLGNLTKSEVPLERGHGDSTERSTRIEMWLGVDGPREVFMIAPYKRFSVGRASENDLVLDDPSVSKTHAVLILGPDGRLRVADTGSTNGTNVRGNRIEIGAVETVEPGEEVVFGECSAIFHYEVLGGMR